MPPTPKDEESAPADPKVEAKRRKDKVLKGESLVEKKGKGRRFFGLGFEPLRHIPISELPNAG